MDLRGFGGGGGLFSSIGKFFSGFFADGGLIPTGSFGIAGEAGPEPIFATAGGVGVLPNSALRCGRSEEHTSELQSLMRNSYAVFCLKKTNNTNHTQSDSQ